MKLKSICLILFSTHRTILPTSKSTRHFLLTAQRIYFKAWIGLSKAYNKPWSHKLCIFKDKKQLPSTEMVLYVHQYHFLLLSQISCSDFSTYFRSITFSHYFRQWEWNTSVMVDSFWIHISWRCERNAYGETQQCLVCSRHIS